VSVNSNWSDLEVVAVFFRLVGGSGAVPGLGWDKNFPQFEPSHPGTRGDPGSRSITLSQSDP